MESSQQHCTVDYCRRVTERVFEGFPVVIILNGENIMTVSQRLPTSIDDSMMMQPLPEVICSVFLHQVAADIKRKERGILFVLSLFAFGLLC